MTKNNVYFWKTHKLQIDFRDELNMKLNGMKLY